MGITIAAHILNFVVMIAALSVYNSGMYANGRMLYSLAKKGKAPKFLATVFQKRRTGCWHLVLLGITLIAVVLNFFMPDKVFGYLMALVVVVLIVCWVSIVITHMKFRQMHIKAGTVDTIKFKSILFPFANYLCLAFFVFVLAIMATMDSMRRSEVYLLPVWLIIMGVTYKMSHKKSQSMTNCLTKKHPLKVFCEINSLYHLKSIYKL